jgi:hypothetical protein
VRERLTRRPTRELLLAHRFPVALDELHGIPFDVGQWQLELLRPEAQTRLAGDVGIVRHDIHLRVVEERVLVQVAEPIVSQRSSTIPTFA